MDEEENQEQENIRNAEQPEVKEGINKINNVKKAVESVNRSNAVKGKLATAMGPVIFWAVVIIVVLIIVVGIIMFFITMPGMVLEKLKALFRDAGNWVAALFGADTTEQIDDVQIFDTLDYLEDLGYDLKGYGFLTDYYSSNDEKYIKKQLSKEQKKEFSVDDIDDIGVVRDSDGKIILAKSDFIFTYLVSENYAYTIKNNNLVTQSKNGGLLGVVQSMFEGVLSAGIKALHFVGVDSLFENVFKTLGANITSPYEAWGKGFLAIYDEKGNLANYGTLWNWDSVKIDIKAKTMTIKRRSIFNNNNAMKYSLDGWTGRYSIPADFLLSLHVATLMPDLSYEIATGFPTNANIYLHKAEGEAIAYYKTENDEYVSFGELNSKINVEDGRSFFSKLLSWFDNLKEDDKEMAIASAMGIKHSPECTCKKKDIIEKYIIDSNNREHYVIEKDGKYYYFNFSYEEFMDYAFKLGDDGYSKAVDELEKTEITDTSSIKSKKVGEVYDENGYCKECKSYLKEIINMLKQYNDYDFNYYIPYLKSVTNHWYRDVYFMINKSDSKKLIKLDSDYEALYRERWTLYETYTEEDNSDYAKEHNNEYKLYLINKKNGKYENSNDLSENYSENVINKLVKTDDNMYLFQGTMDEAEEMGIIVSKKAISIKGEELEDYGWINVGEVWSAYKFTGSYSDQEYVPAYTDGQIEEEKKEVRKTIMKDMYGKVSGNANVVQVGEGMRTETNPYIKKIFLSNTYFKYDGSVKTAEVITKVRNKIGEELNENTTDKWYYKELPVSPYGALNCLEDGDGLIRDFTNKEYTIEVEGETNKYKVKDLSGKVTLNQDSLNTFSMLENVHTLDADYIYRDFKELVVELGYFTKEELTDETPRLLEWLVPDIGSGGYPNRTIDKRENEYGTMIHSKGDIEANNSFTFEQIAGESLDVELEDGDSQGNQTEKSPSIDDNTQNSENSEEAKLRKKDLSKTVGATGDSGKTYTIDESLSGDGYSYGVELHGVTYLNYKQGQGSYASLPFGNGNYSSSACGPTSCAILSSAYGSTNGPKYFGDKLGSPPSLGGIKKVLEEEGISGESYTIGTSSSNTLSNDARDLAQKMEDALNEGKPVIVLVGKSDKFGEKDNQYTSGGHYFVFIGIDDDGTPIYCNTCSDTHEYTHRGSFNTGSLIEEFVFYYMQHSERGNRGIYIPDEAPSGLKKKSNPYVGYNGNEAVVSPVTGILLEYGVYNDGEREGKDIDSITGEEYRVNVDMKYGPLAQSDEYEAEIISDHVGYAKILVLDKENYTKLEEEFLEHTDVIKDSLIGDYGGFKDDEKLLDKDDKKISEYLKKWNECDKTLYGYKEFAERYEEAGIAGYVVYIDGFIPELPDEEFTEEDLKKKIPYDGKGSTENRFTMDETSEGISFKKIKVADLTNDGNEENILQSKYIADEEYKLSSISGTNKLKTEIKLKKSAAPSTYLEKNDLIVLKEGTVIGRTMTDKELLEADYLRNSEHGTFDEIRQGKSANEEDGDSTQNKVIGNYIRIIMRDLDTTPVENVEDYMKLDVNKEVKSSLEQFMYWQAKETEGFEYIIDGQESYALRISNGRSRSDNPSDKYGHNYYVDDGNVGDINLCPGMYLAQGYPAQKIFTEVTGKSDIAVFETFCTGEQLYEIYTKVLESEVETLRSQYPVLEELEDDDPRLFALIDVMYAGPGNFKIGTIDDKLLAGDLNLTKEDFLSNATPENTFYHEKHPNQLARRRLGAYYIYAEGKYGYKIYDDSASIDSVEERYEFFSETPFQDLMRDTEGAEVVSMDS